MTNARAPLPLQLVPIRTTKGTFLVRPSAIEYIQVTPPDECIVAVVFGATPEQSTVLRLSESAGDLLVRLAYFFDVAPIVNPETTAPPAPASEPEWRPNDGVPPDVPWVRARVLYSGGTTDEIDADPDELNWSLVAPYPIVQWRPQVRRK